jgi:hypothetical protein
LGAKFGAVLDKSTGRVRELGRDDKGRPFGAMIVRPDFNAPRMVERRKSAPSRSTGSDLLMPSTRPFAPQEIRVHGDGRIVKTVKVERVRDQFYKRHVTGQTGLMKS